MNKRLLLLVICLSLLCVNVSLAQTSGNPTIAILRYGGIPDELTITEYGVLDLLQSYAFISAEERVPSERRIDLAGENISIIWGDAGWDLPSVNLLIEAALDQGADVLVTLTTPVTRAAVNATLGMDDPPAIFFASVYNPAEAGISQAPCIKPDHVTGSEIQAPYLHILSLLQIQNPDISTIGVIYSSGEVSGRAGARRIKEVGESLGLTIQQAAVISLADFPAAVQSLVGEEIEALVLPIDSVTAQALPVIVGVANENGLPLFYPVLGSVFYGATFGIGFQSYYEQGLNLGRMLTAYLTGDLDTATTGISIQSGAGHSVNLDAAAAQDIEIAQVLIDQAEVVVQDNESTMSEAFIVANSVYRMEQLRVPEARDYDGAFLKSLHCAPELIAEQQAALDAAE